MKMWTTAAVTFIVGAALLMSAADATTSCYTCDSGSNPVACGVSNFNSLLVTKKDGCTCCTKSVNNGVAVRGCVQETIPTNCIPLPNTNYVCTDNLCNSSPALSYRVIVPMATVAIAVLVNLLY